MKLEAQKREVVGKKVKNLRLSETVPASVYGPKKPSTNIQVDKKTFLKLFKEVSYNKFFDLEVEGEKPAKVLVKEIQKNPVTDKLLSISFYQVDENSKIYVDVPVEFVGDAPAVKLNLGFLIQQMDVVSLHCLPKDLPSKLEVDLGLLLEAGDAITVGDIKLPEGVELDSEMDPTTAIVYIGTAQKEEVEEKPAEEAAVEGAEGAAAPAAAGAAAAGEKKEEKK